MPDGTKAFAHTQALWRFLANQRVTPEGLALPLVMAGREAVTETGCDWVLSVHDWSRLSFRTHIAKQDRLQMTHDRDVGYELQSSLLVSADDGAPLSVPVQNLVTAKGVWQSRSDGVVIDERAHLDELTERMQWMEAQQFGARLVHLVDREADSVGHLRTWKRAGCLWLIRVKAGSRVRYGKRSMAISAVAAGLTFHREREVQCDGQKGIQWVASAAVVLTRPARPKQMDAHGKRVAPIPGEPLSVRLVVSRIYDASGQRVIAEWYLLDNLPDAVPPAQIALWYYFRWRIESFFKLLKKAGHQLESWEQETGGALFKRLLIASHACVLAWHLERARGDFAEQTRAFLVRLSGRQMKASRPVTTPALLDGLFKLLAMLHTLEHYSLQELKAFADTAFGPRLHSP